MGRLHLSLVDRHAESEDTDSAAAGRRAEELENAERQFKCAYEILLRDG